MRVIHIYTDGSCDVHDPRQPGGWGAILIDCATGVEKSISGTQSETTNNQMEITAAIEAMKAIRGGPHKILIHTDSRYLIGAMTGNKRKKNQDLLQQLDELMKKHEVKFKHVKGHNGDAYNHRVDRLAVKARKRL